MSADVLPFPQQRRMRVPSSPEVARKVRRMLKFNRMMMPHPKMKEWISTKSITLMQVITTLKQGEPTGEPIFNANGDWELTLRRVAAGRRTHVTIALKADHFVIVNIN
jgi:hypothetical protein